MSTNVYSSLSECISTDLMDFIAGEGAGEGREVEREISILFVLL